MASIKLKGDTSGEVIISAPSVAGASTLELQATNGTIATTADISTFYNSLGNRNLIINGKMQVAQRGTSKTGITGSGYYTCDRFDIGGTTFGTWTQSQDTDVPPAQGFANSIKFLCTTANASLGANSFLQMHQSIEGQNLQYLKKGTSNAESVTVSFWVKSNKTGTYIVNLYDIDNTRIIAKAYTINDADTWEKKTLTFAGDTTAAFDNDNGRSLDLSFGLCAGADFSSGTLQTTWAAANNSNRYDMELQRCQRYFQRFQGGSAFTSGVTGCYNSATSAIGLHTHIVPFRASPTFSYSAISHFDLEPFDAQPTTLTSNSSGNLYQASVSATDPTSRVRGYAVTITCDNAAGYFDFSAEL
jgi:hypothetical protein